MWYCDYCGQAFLHTKIECPNCHCHSGQHKCTLCFGKALIGTTGTLCYKCANDECVMSTKVRLKTALVSADKDLKKSLPVEIVSMILKIIYDYCYFGNCQFCKAIIIVFNDKYCVKCFYNRIFRRNPRYRR